MGGWRVCRCRVEPEPIQLEERLEETSSWSWSTVASRHCNIYNSSSRRRQLARDMTIVSVVIVTVVCRFQLKSPLYSILQSIASGTWKSLRYVFATECLNQSKLRQNISMQNSHKIRKFTNLHWKICLNLIFAISSRRTMHNTMHNITHTTIYNTINLCYIDLD